MERRRVVIGTMVILAVALVGVPSCGLVFKGCQAGTKGLLEWLPRPWDSAVQRDGGCQDGGRLLTEGRQTPCPPKSTCALEQLLGDIGFFGTRESQELAVCRFSKGTWNSITTSISRARDAAMDFHQSVTRSLAENSISVESLVELVIGSITNCISNIKEITQEIVAKLVEPVVNIPRQLSQQHGQLWEFYNKVRTAHAHWTSSYLSPETVVSSSSVGLRGMLDVRWKQDYLLPIWRYIACDTKKTSENDKYLRIHTSDPMLTVQSGVIGVKPSLIPEESEPHPDWQLKTQAYVDQLMNYVTNSPDQDSSYNTLEHSHRSDDVSMEDESVVLKTETVQPRATPRDFSPTAVSPSNTELPAMDQAKMGQPENMFALKQILFEALVATVLAFSLFILAVVFRRLAQERKLGLKWPSLAKILVGRYKPVKVLHSSENFNSFLMISKRTRQKVFAKCPKAAAASEAITGLNNELYCLKRMNHSNVVAFVECVRVSTRFCLTLEYACYGSLAETIQKPVKPVGFQQKICIYSQILHAVNWMHKSGWGHLNIRPGTILVFEQWYLVKLSGFTRAVELRRGELCYDFHLHPMCASPCVITKQAYNPVKADLWALGSLLYFIFTKRAISSSQEAIRVAGVVARMDYDRRPAHGLNLIKLLADLLSFYPHNRPPICVLLDAIDYFM